MESLLPLANVGGELGARTSSLPDTESFTSILTGVGERRVALIVDGDHGRARGGGATARGSRPRIPVRERDHAPSRRDGGLDARRASDRGRARGALPAEVVRAPEAGPRDDDSATTRELERTLLRVNGFDVETAVDGRRRGCRSAPSRRTRFDIVSRDVEMPRLDGFGLLGRIHCPHRGTHVFRSSWSRRSKIRPTSSAPRHGGVGIYREELVRRGPAPRRDCPPPLMPVRVLLVNDSRRPRARRCGRRSRTSPISSSQESSRAQRGGDGRKQVDPDVVPGDIVMQADGYEVTRRILRARRVPILMVSASVSPTDVAVALGALRAGAIAVLERRRRLRAHLRREAPGHHFIPSGARLRSRGRAWPAPGSTERRRSADVARAPAALLFDRGASWPRSVGARRRGRSSPRSSRSSARPPRAAHRVVVRRRLPDVASRRGEDTRDAGHARRAGGARMLIYCTWRPPPRRRVMARSRSTAPPIGGFRHPAITCHTLAMGLRPSRAVGVVLTGMDDGG